MTKRHRPVRLVGALLISSTTPTLSPSLPSPRHSTTRPQPLQSGEKLHESFTSHNLQHTAQISPISSSLARMKLFHPRPPILQFFTLFPGPIFSRPNREIAVGFKQVALSPLDRFSRDAARKHSYIKIATMLEDVVDARIS